MWINPLKERWVGGWWAFGREQWSWVKILLLAFSLNLFFVCGPTFWIFLFSQFFPNFHKRRNPPDASQTLLGDLPTVLFQTPSSIIPHTTRLHLRFVARTQRLSTYRPDTIVKFKTSKNHICDWTLTPLNLVLRFTIGWIETYNCKNNDYDWPFFSDY